MTNKETISLIRLVCRLTESTVLDKGNQNIIKHKQIKHDYKILKNYLKIEVKKDVETSKTNVDKMV